MDSNLQSSNLSMHLLHPYNCCYCSSNTQCTLTKQMWDTNTIYGCFERLRKKIRKSFRGQSSFFFPLPPPHSPIPKIRDVITSCESLPGRRQLSIALWIHTFIKRRTSLSTGAKHAHSNHMRACARTHTQKDEKKKNS